jgi:hypothetical protein
MGSALEATREVAAHSQICVLGAAAFFLSFSNMNEKDPVAAGSVATRQSPPHMRELKKKRE